MPTLTGDDDGFTEPHGSIVADCKRQSNMKTDSDSKNAIRNSP